MNNIAIIPVRKRIAMLINTLPDNPTEGQLIEEAVKLNLGLGDLEKYILNENPQFDQLMGTN